MQEVESQFSKRVLFVCQRSALRIVIDHCHDSSNLDPLMYQQLEFQLLAMSSSSAWHNDHSLFVLFLP